MGYYREIMDVAKSNLSDGFWEILQYYLKIYGISRGAEEEKQNDKMHTFEEIVQSIDPSYRVEDATELFIKTKIAPFLPSLPTFQQYEIPWKKPSPHTVFYVIFKINEIFTPPLFRDLIFSDHDLAIFITGKDDFITLESDTLMLKCLMKEKLVRWLNQSEEEGKTCVVCSEMKMVYCDCGGCSAVVCRTCAIKAEGKCPLCNATFSLS